MLNIFKENGYNSSTDLNIGLNHAEDRGRISLSGDQKETPPKRRKNGGVKKNHLLGESNPCCRDENPVS